jgi:hypothetical protein
LSGTVKRRCSGEPELALPERPPPHMPWEVSWVSLLCGRAAFGHRQRSFEPLLSLLTSNKSIPGGAPAGLPSFSRHGDVKSDGQNDGGVPVIAPELRIA